MHAPLSALIIAITVLTGATAFAQTGQTKDVKTSAASTSIYDLSFTSMDGKKVKLETYRGKWIMFVNVASHCGYTPQYAELEKLHRSCGDRLVIVGFPANDFGAQEPGSNEEIVTFCREKYDVSFVLSQKIHVIGDETDPIYRWLTDPAQNGWNSDSPKWNFFKYLVDPDGKLVKVFTSKVPPLGTEIAGSIGTCK
jgi:glutathione peroxidase